LENTPPPPGDKNISCWHLGKNVERGREKGWKMLKKNKERGKKRKKGKETEKMGSKRVK
jgi:hypothetical protein